MMLKMMKFLVLVLLAIGANSGWVKEMENPGLYQGDIVLSPEQMQQVKAGTFTFASTAHKKDLWPNAVVPYTLNSVLQNSEEFMREFKHSISEYHKYTCIRFKKRTNERGYISFNTRGGCSSWLGYSGGKNPISLGKGCWWRSTIMHEIAHSLGIHHEQTRPDRDQYVDILYKNIIKGTEYNFEKQSQESIDSQGTPYDYQSMMHYAWDAFGSGGSMSIRTKDPNQQYEIGNGLGDWGFSPIDIVQLNRLYRCNGTYPKLERQYTPPTKDCYDRRPCAALAFKGDCTSPAWKFYLSQNCRKTCKFCTIDGSGGGGTHPTMGPQPTNGPKPTNSPTTTSPRPTQRPRPTNGPKPSTGPRPTNGPRTTSGIPCVNRVVDCANLGVHRCNDRKESWRKYMKRSCRRYCGFC